MVRPLRPYDPRLGRAPVVSVLVNVDAMTKKKPKNLSLPLLSETDIFSDYLGGFRVPAALSNGYDWGYAAAGGMDFNPANNSLIVCNGFGVGELSIPALVAAVNPMEMHEGTYLQPMVDPGEGKITAECGTSDWKIGNPLLSGEYLYFNAYMYFDSGGVQVKSHFRHYADLSRSGGYAGLVQVSDAPEAGWVSTIMGRVPEEWRAALGGPAVTGGGGIPIITRQPYGHSLYAFDPAAHLHVTTPVPASIILGHPDSHPLGGHEWASQNDLWNGSSVWHGVTLINNSRTCLIAGFHGTGPWCYGNGGAGPPDSECLDWVIPAHGTHAYPYRYQVWAYDLEELAAVKAGTKESWEPQPYAVMVPTFPTPSGYPNICGTAYDAERSIYYVMQGRVHGYDLAYPVVHAFQVNVSGATTPPPIEPEPAPEPDEVIADVVIRGTMAIRYRDRR
jgi:hypothetical protein